MKELSHNLAKFLSGRFIMVVEPTTNYRNSIKQFLTNLKVRNIKVVSSVAEAKRMLLTTKVGFFISEWRLSEQNGIQFCRELRKNYKMTDIPFLLISVENLRNDVILASEVQIDGYLLKPFSFEDFCIQLNTIIQSRMNPSRATLVLEMADGRLQSGDHAQAEVLYKEALQLNNSSARALTGLGKIAKTKGKPHDALRLLQQACDLNPEYLESFREMLAIYEQIQDKGSIIRVGNILHNLSPDNPKYTLALAKTYLEIGNLVASENFFRKTIRLSPTLAEGYKGLGNIYLQNKDYERAMKNFNKALDLEKDDISTLNSLGLTYVRKGMIDEGLKKYRIALKLDPHDSRVLFNIAQAYEKFEDFENSGWYYQKALSSDPHLEKAKRGLERIKNKKDSRINGKPLDDSLEDDDKVAV